MGQTGADIEVTPEPTRKPKSKKRKGKKLFSWLCCVRAKGEDSCQDIPASVEAEDRNEKLDFVGKANGNFVPTTDAASQVDKITNTPENATIQVSSTLDLQEDLQRLEDRIASLQRDNCELKLEVERSHSTIEDTNEIMLALQVKVEEVMFEKEHELDLRAKHHREELDSVKDAFFDEIEFLQTEIEDKSQQLGVVLEKMTRQSEEAEGMINGIRVLYEKLLSDERAANLRLRTENDMVKEQVSNLQKELDIKNKATESFQENLQKLQKDNLKLTCEIEQNHRTIEEKNQIILALQAKVEEITIEKERQLESRVMNHNVDMKNLKEKLIQETESLQTESQSLKTQNASLEMDRQEVMTNESQDLDDSDSYQRLRMESEKYQEQQLMYQRMQEEHKVPLHSAEETSKQRQTKSQQLESKLLQLKALSENLDNDTDDYERMLMEEMKTNLQLQNKLSILRKEGWAGMPRVCTPTRGHTSQNISEKSHAPSRNKCPKIAEKIVYEEQLKRIMESKDFRQRLRGIDQLVKDSEQRPGMVLGCKFSVFDALGARLLEANRKINLHALEALLKIIPRLKNDMAPVVNALVPCIVDTHLNTKSDAICRAAIGTLQALIHNIDNAALVDIFCSKAKHLTGRARGILIDMVAELVPDLYTRRPQTVEQKVLPLLWPLLDSFIYKEATARLCHALHAEMGHRLRVCAASQPLQIIDKLNNLLGTY
ncbi:hypothetical protein MATL_G00254670 [Megalops atlanticus]|uniref:TOG domain-containing protein n=1 Tax=Megalops atlanticus TaxID=7932 RepID=A0A9D3T0A5_MEGAT|nr:hypothetical protein MATL_G00254670 [Megalops atlanticus]